MKTNLSAVLRGSALALVLNVMGLPAVAGECWVATRAEPVSASGEPLSAPKFIHLVAASNAAEKMLHDDAALNAITGMRFQANRSITFVDNEWPTYTANTWVTLHEPDVWGKSGCTLDQGQADYRNTRGIEISFNEVSRVLNLTGASVGEPEDPMLVLMDPQALAQFQRTGLLVQGNEAGKVFRVDGKPIIIPYTLDEHFAFWERKLLEFSDAGADDYAGPELKSLRADRSSKSQVDLSAPVWMSGEASGKKVWGYAEAGDPQGVPAFQIAPDLFAAGRDPLAINLIVVSTYSQPDDSSFVALRRWVGSFDIDDARVLLERSGK